MADLYKPAEGMSYWSEAKSAKASQASAPSGAANPVSASTFSLEPGSLTNSPIVSAIANTAANALPTKEKFANVGNTPMVTVNNVIAGGNPITANGSQMPNTVAETRVKPEPYVTEHIHKEDVTFNMKMMGANQEPVQNAPVVQPLVIVPYVSQMQPIYQYTPAGMKAAYGNNLYMPQPSVVNPYGGYGVTGYNGADADNSYEDVFDGFGFDEGEVVAKKKKAKGNDVAAGKRAKRANGTAIAGFIFGLIAIAFLVISYFNILPETIAPIFYILKGKGLISLIMEDLINGLGAEQIDLLTVLPVGILVASALFLVLTFLVNLFSLTARKYPAVGSVFAWLAFLFAVAAMIVVLIEESEIAERGLFVYVGLTCLIMVISLIRKRAIA